MMQLSSLVSRAISGWISGWISVTLYSSVLQSVTERISWWLECTSKGQARMWMVLEALVGTGGI